MNPIAEEMMSYYGLCDYVEDSLLHYGMPRRSGRYPWGSGDNPYQHAVDFIGRVEEKRKNGFTYVDDDGKLWTGDNAIAKSMGMTSTEFRTELGICKNERRAYNVATAKALKKDGLGASEIARQMSQRLGKHINESTVRNWFDEDAEKNMNIAKSKADFIKEQVDKKGVVEIGAGVDKQLGITPEMMKKVKYILDREGYVVAGGRVPQVTNPGQKTTITVVCPPGTPYRVDSNGRKVTKAVYDYSNIYPLIDIDPIEDKNAPKRQLAYPASMDSKRLMVRYADDVGPDGTKGIEKDGIIELRRNIPDLSLGESRYSQVRILVDGTHYLKGMAVYSDDMPPGVDVVFNTNKKKGTPALGPKDNTVLKPIKKDDPENPFGSLIKDPDKGGQYYYKDPKTGEEKLGLINKRSDQGDWTEWADALPAQFLSKQSKKLANQQLKLAIADKVDEYESISSLTNPTIKKHLLNKFADECDSAAVHLKAAALPGQKYHVIIPINSLKDNEVYAPGYAPGTELALIRYPHGGTFEIPILTVTHKNALGQKIIGNDSIDAIGINHKVADRLSGADFDGDTVMAIPTNDPAGKVKITATNELEGLKGFDPKVQYGPDTYKAGTVKLMTKHGTQLEMGKISNLITDMTLKGATSDKLARAVRHSMVVIDAEKHRLNYKQSEIDNDIEGLKNEYQPDGGASTIISRAKSPERVPKRQGSPRVNIKGKDYYDPTRPEGALLWKTADDATYEKTTINKRTGEVKTTIETRTQDSTKMAETDDAYTLTSDPKNPLPMERLYADYANKMKAMANDARKQAMTTGKIKYDSTAKATYHNEVESLMRKLVEAEQNAPKERMAQIRASSEVEARKRAYKEQTGKDMEKGDVRKIGTRALNKYRQEMGSVSRRERNIKITDQEWAAIQAGAISESKLVRILNNADIDELRERAMPKRTSTLSVVQKNRIKALSASNYTLAEIANKLGVSTSTVSKYLKE